MYPVYRDYTCGDNNPLAPLGSQRRVEGRALPAQSVPQVQVVPCRGHKDVPLGGGADPSLLPSSLFPDTPLFKIQCVLGFSENLP